MNYLDTSIPCKYSCVISIFKLWQRWLNLEAYFCFIIKKKQDFRFNYFYPLKLLTPKTELKTTKIVWFLVKKTSDNKYVCNFNLRVVLLLTKLLNKIYQKYFKFKNISLLNYSIWIANLKSRITWFIFYLFIITSLESDLTRIIYFYNTIKIGNWF